MRAAAPAGVRSDQPKRIWPSLLLRVEGGNAPTKAELIAALREEAIPAEMRAYVADRLAGKVPGPSGRPAARSSVTREYRHAAQTLLLRYEILRRAAIHKADRARSYRVRADAETAGANTMSVRALKARLNRGRKALPPNLRALWLSQKHADAALARSRESGSQEPDNNWYLEPGRRALQS